VLKFYGLLGSLPQRAKAIHEQHHDCFLYGCCLIVERRERSIKWRGCKNEIRWQLQVTDSGHVEYLNKVDEAIDSYPEGLLILEYPVSLIQPPDVHWLELKVRLGIPHSPVELLYSLLPKEFDGLPELISLILDQIFKVFEPIHL
jgi:hypothetical protein